MRGLGRSVGAISAAGVFWALGCQSVADGSIATAATRSDVPAATQAKGTTTPPSLPEEEFQRLANWYERIGQRRAGEPFGRLVVRVAAAQLGKPYVLPPQTDEPETLRVQLDSFECVSLVESSLAVARCVWLGQVDAGCFVEELEAWRYRHGLRRGYGSRLHYFAEWIEDNAMRGRLQIITAQLGGMPMQYSFDYMTRHPGLYPALRDEQALAEIAEAEMYLSHRTHMVVDRTSLTAAEEQLQAGDVIGLVGSKHPGMMVVHTGFVVLDPRHGPGLLHASSHHRRVVATSTGVAAYVLRRPERRGLMVARPLPP